MSIIVDLYDTHVWPVAGSIQEPRPTGPALCGKLAAAKIAFRRRCPLEKIAGSSHLCQVCLKLAATL
jgi:hypothetical protein